MAASERAKRTIVRDCRFRAIARIVQHKDAKERISRFVATPNLEIDWLSVEAQALRETIADDDFDQSVRDINADFIERYVAVHENGTYPVAEYEWTPNPDRVEINGVRINTNIMFRAQRVTKTNKIRLGGGAIRYQKGKALPEEVALWQSAFIFGYLNDVNADNGATSEEKLCLTICAHSGTVFQAPTDSTMRFNNMKAACASIAERWENIDPPATAVL